MIRSSSAHPLAQFATHSSHAKTDAWSLNNSTARVTHSAHGPSLSIEMSNRLGYSVVVVSAQLWCLTFPLSEHLLKHLASRRLWESPRPTKTACSQSGKVENALHLLW